MPCAGTLYSAPCTKATTMQHHISTTSWQHARFTTRTKSQQIYNAAGISKLYSTKPTRQKHSTPKQASTNLRSPSAQAVDHMSVIMCTTFHAAQRPRGRTIDHLACMSTDAPRKNCHVGTKCSEHTKEPVQPDGWFQQRIPGTTQGHLKKKNSTSNTINPPSSPTYGRHS